MRVAVMGAGAIGLLYGGWLQQAGADVAFIARGERFRSLQTMAVSAQGRLPFKLDRVRAIAMPDEIAPVDVLLLCVKLYDVKAAAAFALPILKPEGTLIAIQNGVGVFDLVKPFLPPDQIAIGPVYSVTKLISPTSVSYGGLERAVLGNPASDVSIAAKEIVDVWRKAGVDASITDEINTVLWTKFIGVATGSALNCLTRLPAGIIYHDESLLKYVRQSIDEVMAVGRAVGVTFPEGTAENTLAFLKSFPPDAVASMRLDLDAGRRLELEGLSGEVVRLGQLHGISTPLHQIALDMLRPFREGRQQT